MATMAIASSSAVCAAPVAREFNGLKAATNFGKLQSMALLPKTTVGKGTLSARCHSMGSPTNLNVVGSTARMVFAGRFGLAPSANKKALGGLPLVERPSALQTEKAVETVERASTAASEKAQYHFLVANAKFMLDDEEHFQELMRERLRHFGEQNREQDFWLVIEPEFLAKFPDVTSRLGRPAVALVSTDATWITFMKLRLDRVLKGAFEADTVAEALAGGNSTVEIKFEKPERWTAPYPKYEGPWWTPFLPPQ